MNLLRLSPAAFALGAAALAATLLLLHLLRVRLRRRTVDSLLFFQMLGEVRRPRVLPGRPARWLAFALALLASLLALLAVAEPWTASASPSRTLIVDATARARVPARDGRPLLDASLELAAELAAGAGLGPRGRVVAAGASPVVLWQAGEPLDLLQRRGEAIAAAGPPAACAAAVADAGRVARPGDAIWVVGGPELPPPAADGKPPLRFAADASAAAGVLALEVDEATATRLRVVALAAAGTRVTLRDIERGEVASGVLVAAGEGVAAVDLDLPPGSLVGEILLGGSDPLPLSIPARPRGRVWVGADAPTAVRRAVEADPRLEAVDGEPVEVVVGSIDAGSVGALSSPARVMFASGRDPAPRRPRVTAASPLGLGLRDRARPDATALEPIAGETIWVEDADDGRPLVAAARAADGTLRIRIVDWLLEPASHRDVPLLIAGALRVAAGVGPVGPLELGATATRPAATAGLRTIDGRPAFATAGSVEVAAADAVTPTIAPPGPATAQEPPAPTPGPTPWIALLIGGALVLIGIDAWLFGRGRIP